MNTLCIWCLRPSSDKDVEHVFPEALGCPDHLTLPGTVVCRRCNTGLAHLDQIVADDFDLVALLKHIPRKRGRPPEIANRGNFYGNLTDKGPQLFFNLESYRVKTHIGRELTAYRGNTRDIRPEIKGQGVLREVSFGVPFGQHKKFVRGVTKIAFNAFTFLLGPDLARSHAFDSVRDFVRHGGEKRKVIVSACADDMYTLSAEPPWKSSNDEYCIEIRIATTRFLVDLSRSQSIIPILEAKTLEEHGPNGWTTLPTGA